MNTPPSPLKPTKFSAEQTKKLIIAVLMVDVFALLPAVYFLLCAYGDMGLPSPFTGEIANMMVAVGLMALGGAYIVRVVFELKAQAQRAGKRDNK